MMGGMSRDAAPVAHSDGSHAVEGFDLLHQLRHRRGPAHEHGRIACVVACDTLQSGRQSWNLCFLSLSALGLMSTVSSGEAVAVQMQTASRHQHVPWKLLRFSGRPHPA